MAGPHPRHRLADSAFLRACRCEPHDTVPVWFMRQAGRSLPEYRARRGEGTILDAIAQPDLAAELTMQPVRRYGVDAAILYSDIVVPVHAVGFGIDVAPGTGPVTPLPFRSAADLERLRPLEPDQDLPYVIETVEILAGELDVPLIGFAGAPFTVASYLIEGGPSREYARTKAMMLGEPGLFARLLDRLADLALAFLRAQVQAGASAVQLFDSWAGALAPEDYRAHVLPASRRIFDGLADLDVPRIHFGVGTGEILGLMAEAGPDVMGVDWRVPLDAARRRVGPGVALQGNLDPASLFAPWPAVAPRVADVLRQAAGHPGHVFNLGHGVLPATDPDVLHRVVDLVHELGPQPEGLQP
jgi:uroporphyrinogen decarboxylase